MICHPPRGATRVPPPPNGHHRGHRFQKLGSVWVCVSRRGGLGHDSAQMGGQQLTAYMYILVYTGVLDKDGVGPFIPLCHWALCTFQSDTLAGGSTDDGGGGS